MITNAIVYISLLSLTVGVEFNPHKFSFYWGGENLTLFRYRLISPLLVALLSFGTGKAKFQYADKEFSIYDSLLNFFRSMFSLSLEASKQLKTAIEKLGEETEKLTLVIDNLHLLSEERKWVLPKDLWKDISGDKQLIEGEIALLNQIDDNLDRENFERHNVVELRNHIAIRITKVRVFINNRLKRYIRKVIVKNIKDERAIEKIADIINVSNPSELVSTDPPNYGARSLGLSILCGTVLGMVHQFTGQVHSPNQRIFYLCIAFFVFFFLMSFLNRMKPTVEGFSFALALGAVAGFSAHFSFEIINRGLSTAIGANKAFVIIVMDLANMCVFGMVLGIISALIIHVFRHHGKKVFIKPLHGYLCLALLGGISYWILGLAFQQTEVLLTIAAVKENIALFAAGIITLGGITFVTGIFEVSKKPFPKGDKDEDRVVEESEKVMSYGRTETPDEKPIARIVR
jgi:hypothetical protein